MRRKKQVVGRDGNRLC